MLSLRFSLLMLIQKSLCLLVGPIALVRRVVKKGITDSNDCTLMIHSISSPETGLCRYVW